MIVNIPQRPPVRPSSAGGGRGATRPGPASAPRALRRREGRRLVVPVFHGDGVPPAQRSMSACVGTLDAPMRPSSFVPDRPSSARPRMQAGHAAPETRIAGRDRVPRDDLSDVSEENPWDGSSGGDSALTRFGSGEHSDVMRVARDSLATAHAARSSSELLRVTQASREEQQGVKAKQKAHVAWAAHRALTEELESAMHLLEKDDDAMDAFFAEAPMSPLRHGPTTPPLLQRPAAASDPDEASPAIDSATWQQPRFPAPRPPKGKSAEHGIRSGSERGGKIAKRGSTVAVAIGAADSAGLKADRRDALKRSVEAIESMSLALDAVNEEKRVLERVLDACKTSESVARDQKMYSDTRTGSRRLAQAQYIAQMLPGVDSRVVERMAESMRDGIEAALSLKLAHAQGVAKIVELQGLLDAPFNGGLEMDAQNVRPDSLEPVHKMREELRRLRSEHESLRVQLLSATQKLLRSSTAKKSGTADEGAGADTGASMVITFLQQDLAAAKAQMLALQADAASAMEHARRVKLEADSETEQLRKENISLHAQLVTMREAFDASEVGRLQEARRQDLSDSARRPDMIAEHDRPAAPTPKKALHIRAETEEIAASVRGVAIAAAHAGRLLGEAGETEAVDVVGNMLSDVLSEFNSQLACNYSEIRTALHADGQEASAMALVQQLVSLVSAPQSERGKEIAAPRDGTNDARIAALYAELDALCVQREMALRRALLEVQDTDVEMSAENVERNESGLTQNESPGLLTQEANMVETGAQDDCHREMPSANQSFTGERLGRGGVVELEAWREAGRLEAARMIESAQQQALSIHSEDDGRVEVLDGNIGKLSSDAAILQPALSLNLRGAQRSGGKQGSASSSYPHTPRSCTHTPRSQQSGDETLGSQGVAGGLAEHARSLRSGGLAAETSYGQESADQLHGLGGCDAVVDTEVEAPLEFSTGRDGDAAEKRSVHGSSPSLSGGVEMLHPLPPFPVQPASTPSLTSMPDVNRQRDVVQEEMRPRNAHFADTDQGRPRDRVGGERQRATLRRQRTIPKLQEEEEDELLGAECEGNDEDVTRGAEEERPGRPARVYLGSEGLDAESLISNDSARLGGPGEGRALDQRLDQLVCALEDKCRALSSQGSVDTGF